MTKRAKILSISAIAAILVAALVVLLLVVAWQTNSVAPSMATVTTPPPESTAAVTPTPDPTPVAAPTPTVTSQPTEATPKPAPSPTIIPTLAPTDTPFPVPQATAESEEFCYRTPAVQRVILNRLQTTRCLGLTAAELFRIEDIDHMESVQFKDGDFGWLVNLRGLSIVGGDKETPLPTGLFRELQNVVNLSMTTIGQVQPGLLSGLESVTSMELTIGNNASGSSNIFNEEMIENQRELPVDLLCDTPELEELNLQFAGRLSDAFFDCVPELRILQIRNYDRDTGSHRAANYTLDLSPLHKLEQLTLPGTLNMNDGRRKVILSDRSPVLIQTSNHIRSDGPSSCPNYISDGSWIMCVSVTAKQ